MKARFLLIWLVPVLLLSCSSNPTTPEGNGGSGTTEAAPKSGTWTAATDFGKLEFVVSSDGRSITEIKYTFSGWKGKSGSIKISNNTSWSIASRKFEIKNDLDPDPLRTENWTVTGTFAASGIEANGTWKAVIGGTTSSGSWKGSPQT
jgi:hypothetical protein